jgi:hypothetical protein
VMSPKSKLNRVRPRRKNKGVGFIFFILIAIPIFIVAGALAIDMGNVVVSHRDVVNANESAALAGAGQIYNGQLIDANGNCPSGGSGTCCPPGESGDCTAAGVALATFEQEEQNSSMPNVSVVGDPTITLGTYDGVQTITITTYYTITGLIFNRVPWLGDYGSHQYSVSESAFVCDEGDTNGPTGGECSAPQIAF